MKRWIHLGRNPLLIIFLFVAVTGFAQKEKPNNGNFYIETGDFNWTGDLTLSIFNINGEIIHWENFKDNNSNHKIEINLKGISQGIYFVRLINHSKIISEKISII